MCINSVWLAALALTVSGDATTDDFGSATGNQCGRFDSGRGAEVLYQADTDESASDERLAHDELSVGRLDVDYKERLDKLPARSH